MKHQLQNNCENKKCVSRSLIFSVHVQYVTILVKYNATCLVSMYLSSTYSWMASTFLSVLLAHIHCVDQH